MMKRLFVSVFLCLPCWFVAADAAETGALADSRFINLIKKIRQKSQTVSARQTAKDVEQSAGVPAAPSPAIAAGEQPAAIPQPAPSPQPDPALDEDIGIPVGEELLLGIYVAKYYLSDVFAYKNRANARIGLSNLFEVLDFPIEVDLDKQTAVGWFINEGNSFELNFDPQQPVQAVVNGEVIPLSPDSYSLEPDDLYVDADVINFYAETFGVKRVVLPRVLSVPEIAAINAETDVETEVFVFGGLCVMAEGRCSLSSYATGLSPNMNGV